MKRKRNIQIDTVNARNPKLTIPIDEPTFANAILDRLVHNAYPRTVDVSFGLTRAIILSNKQKSPLFRLIE